MKYNDVDENGDAIEIPSMYKVPYIKLKDSERTEQDKRGPGPMPGLAWGGGATRPRKHLYIVSFKCSRVDVFYLLDNTGLFIKEGDIVIVEADRGQDLGTVQHAGVTPDEARLYKRKYGEEQYKWLMMFSKNNQQGNVNPNAQIYGENNAGGGDGGGRARSALLANAPATMQGLPRDNFNNLKPKAIKRLASSHEIRMLAEKEGNEAKAKRTCQGKVQHLHLDMEILDAEWQWDFQKLIFYYYADHYINFKDLITELYRIYKTRIWLSAINPASFSQHALGQPPSGIGPGAIGGFNGQVGNTYTMAYGPDPDPYGAVPPYRIGYDTYTPNFPAIPGVANSFAPTGMGMAGYEQGYDDGSGDATPSVQPGVNPTGNMSDYNYFYGNVTAPDIRNINPKSVGPQHLFPSTNPNYQPAYTPYGGTNPLAMMGNNPTQFGPTPFTSSASPSSNIASVGRAAPSLGPIGTRPPSNGNSTRTIPPIPGLSMPGMTGFRGSNQMSAATPTFSPWNSNVSGRESSGMLDRYLDGFGKQSAQDRHADDMSRER